MASFDMERLGFFLILICKIAQNQPDWIERHCERQSSSLTLTLHLDLNLDLLATLTHEDAFGS